MMKKYFLIFIILLISFVSIQSQDTISLLKEAIKKEPNNLKLRTDLANEYYKNGYYKDAIDEYKNLIKKNKFNEYILYRLIISYLNIDKYKNAGFYSDMLKEMKKEVIETKQVYDIYLNIGIIAFEKKDYKYAKKILKKVYKYNKSQFMANMALGIINFNNKNLKKSLDYFINAYNNMPGSYNDRDNLITNIIVSATNIGQKIYLSDNKNKYKNSLEYFNIASEYKEKLSKNFAKNNLDSWIDSYFLKARCLIKLKEYNKAKKLLIFVFEKDKNKIGLLEFMSNLAVIFQEKNDYLSSIELYSRIFQINDSDIDYLYNVATYYYEKNEWQPALWYIDRCINLSENKSKYIHIYTRILDNYIKELLKEANTEYKKGNNTDAYINYSKILHYKPKNKNIQKIVEKIEISNLKDRNNYFILKNNMEKNKLIDKAESFYELANEYYKKNNYIKSYKTLEKAIRYYYPENKYHKLYLKIYPIITARIEHVQNQIDDYLSDGKIQLAQNKLSEIKDILNKDIYSSLKEKIRFTKSQTKYNQVLTFINNMKYYYRKKNFNKAKQYISKILRIDKNNKTAYNYLNRIRRKEKNLIKKYKKLYEKAKNNNNQSKMYDYLNEILFIDKNNQYAKNNLNKLSKIRKEKAKQKAQNYYYQGIKYYTAGDFKKAINIWQKVLDIYGNYKNTKSYIKRAKDKLKD